MFTTGLSTTLLLVLLGTTVFFVLASHNLSRSVRENLVVTLLLDDEVDSIAGQKMADILRTERYAASSAYISKSQALAEQTKAMGLDPTEFLEANPFNASIELHLTADYTCTDSIIMVTTHLKALPHIADVLCQRDLVERITRTLNQIGYVMLGLAVLLTIISFTLINNTVRLAIHARRHTIHTMRLVGASWSFIRRPFMVRSLWLGLVSGIIATAIVCGTLVAATRFDTTLAPFAPPTTLAIIAITVVAAGIVLTQLCSFVTVGRYLRMRSGDFHRN